MEPLVYFASAHTAAGYRDLLASNIAECEHAILIEGATSDKRSNVIREFFEKWRTRGDEVELLLNSLDPTMLTGVINRSLSCAIIDRTLHLDNDVGSSGSAQQVIDLSDSMKARSRSDEERVLDYQLRKDQAIEEAHDSFHSGLKIHDDLETIFIEAMDFNKADRVAEDLIMDIFKDQMSQSRKPYNRRRFLGASTAQGVVDYVDSLTIDLSKRYLIKGRAGSGKSTLLRKIVTEAEKRDYGIETYHCGFDPDSLDMVVIRELGVAIFDSTAPHEYEPSRHGDQLVDLYETTIIPGTDEKYHEVITRLTESYKKEVSEAVESLAVALEQTHQIDLIDEKLIDLTRLKEQIDRFGQKIDEIDGNS